MLPEDCPVIVNGSLSKETCCFKRYIIFDPEGQSICSPGLWSHLLVHIINKVTVVRNILDVLVPIMSQCTDAQETYSDHNKAARFQNQLSLPNVFPINGGEYLVFWKTGLFYSLNDLFFIVKPLADSIKYKDKNGVLIMCSRTTEGQKVLCELIDIVNKLISEWYPELVNRTTHKVPCHICAEIGDPDPYELKYCTYVIV